MTEEKPTVERDLIFDLGMHRGLDTEFYLKKGFRVVALEASPALCSLAHERFSAEIGSGRLIVVQQALWQVSGQQVSFYVNPVKDDWSSVLKWWAEKGGHQCDEISVTTLTLSDLFSMFGVPYYIKCDIEGADRLFTHQLKADHRRPLFVSVEAISEDLLVDLDEAGYSKFQIVNQSLNWGAKCPQPPLEGKYVDQKFNGHMSGLFGKELPSDRWLSLDECRERYRLFKKLKELDENLAVGWLDFHAAYEA